MPLFMFISGYVSGIKNKFDFDTLKSRYFSLLLPFIVWFVLSYFLRLSFSKNLQNFSGNDFLNQFFSLFKQPDSGFWFIYILFLIYIVMFFLTSIFKKSYLIFGLILYGCLFLVNRKITGTNYGLGLMSWHLGFFLLGNYFFNNKVLEKISKSKLFLPILFIVSVVLVSQWRRTSLPPFIDLLGFTGFAKSIVYELFKIITPISAIVFLSLLFFKTKDLFVQLNFILTKLGKITLEVYLIHLTLITAILIPLLGNKSFPFWQVFSLFVLLLGFSVLLTFFLGRSALLSKVLFGKVPKQVKVEEIKAV